MITFSAGMIVGILLWAFVKPEFQRFCLWLVFDGPINLGKLAPYIFGLGLGRWPKRVSREESMMFRDEYMDS